jgi:hypothetical protein
MVAYACHHSYTGRGVSERVVFQTSPVKRKCEILPEN